MSSISKFHISQFFKLCVYQIYYYENISKTDLIKDCDNNSKIIMCKYLLFYIKTLYTFVLHITYT